MARALSTPLTQEDLVYLRERFPQSRIEWLVSLHGVEEALEGAENGLEQGDGSDGAVDSPEAGEGPEKGEEDLIGTSGQTFDPTEFTEVEIKEYLEANPADRELVLALEAVGRQRKGVLAL